MEGMIKRIRGGGGGIKRGRLSLTAKLLYDSEVEELTRLLEILYYAVFVH